MKRFLHSFLPALTAAGIVTVALYVGARPQAVITPASVSPAAIPPAAVGEATRPASMVPQGGDRLDRWESMAGTAGQLLAVHVEIRELDLAVFPAVCVEALRLKDAARHPLMRLLCIRWAELDGLAALHWVREQFLEPTEGWRWTEMPKEICSVWVAAQPAQASKWFSSLQKGPRQEKEAWEPLIRGGPLHD